MDTIKELLRTIVVQLLEYLKGIVFGVIDGIKGLAK